MSGAMSMLVNPFAPFDAPLQAALAANVRLALAEDVGDGDLTGLLVPAAETVTARVLVRDAAVLCGAPWFEAVMHGLDPGMVIDWRYAEGARMAADSIVCMITAPARALLAA